MPDRLILSLEDIRLTFGGKPLFDGLSLHVTEGDRICLTGKNGAGKTTLMRLMTEDLELDAGKRFLLPGTKVGYLAQAVRYDKHQPVKEFVLSGLPKDEQNEMNEYLAEMVIEPLSLDPSQPMGLLSGGQRRRAALAQALVMDPDVLLLDEPTNHLDLTAIEWLENYLQGFRGAMICISHDRTFLANISRKVFWLDRGTIKVCPYGYARFDDWMEEQIQVEARTLQNLSKKVEAEHDWTQGGVTGRRKRNVRRLRELGRLREKLRQDKAMYKQRSQKIEMDALESPNSSKIMAEFRSVTKSFERDGKKIPILENFSHTLLKGDRLGVLGKNGSGKSTFIKMLVGELECDAGHIFRNKTMEVAYFDQNRRDLDPEKTVQDILCPEGGEYVRLGSGEKEKQVHVRGYLKQFLFDPRLAQTKVSTLSGGQQNRLLLAKVLAHPGNLLVLDEPTNDLDMDTLDMLQELLADYDGTLILVSHDRDFLDRSVTEVMAFEGEARVESLIGGYSDYISWKKNQAKKASEALDKASAASAMAQKGAQKPAKTKLTYGEEIELKELPERMEALQRQIKQLQEELADSQLYTRDPKRFDAVMQKHEEAKKGLVAAEERWLQLEEKQQESVA